MDEREGELPSGYLSAEQALALVAYDDSDVPIGSIPGAADMWGKWRSETVLLTDGRRTPPLMRLRWVWARVRWWQTRQQRHGLDRRCPLPPLPRGSRQKCRDLLRAHRRPVPDIIAELKADIEQTRIAYAEAEKRIDTAHSALKAALANGSVSASGRRGHSSDGSFASLEHEPVPKEYFHNRHRTLCDRIGWASLSFDAPWQETQVWRTAHAPDWGDLLFPELPIIRQFRPKRPEGAVT